MLAQEAAQREALDELRADTARHREKVRQTKEKAMLVSAENVSKQELAASMSNRLSDLSDELGRVMVIQKASSGPVRKTEDEKVASLQELFETTMDRAVRARQAATTVIPANAAKAQMSGPRVTKVFA